jgi:hypothetical protein
VSYTHFDETESGTADQFSFIHVVSFAHDSKNFLFLY